MNLSRAVRNILPYASNSSHVIFNRANNSRVYRSLSDTTLKRHEVVHFVR